MKQKLLQLAKLRTRWRVLAIVAVVASVMVPTAFAMGDDWWGTGGGDFRDTPQRNSYIIHPPVDQLPQSRPGGSSPDGTRLSFIIHRPTAAAGTSIAYMPHQYLVSSTTPNLRFEVRGGVWSEDTAGGADRYDKDSANVDGIVDLVKKNGFLSPVYYEVYQLSNGGQHDGRLLGIINPRDRNIFPTTDNQPNSNDECKFTNGASGPCWRTFEINAPGQPSNAITNRITLNGGAQDSCAVRFGGGDPCFNTRRDNNKEHVHTQDHVWVVRQNNNQQHGHTNGDTPHSHHNPNNSTGDTSQLHHNDDAHDQFNTSPDFYQQPGNCFWDWLNANGTGVQHQHQVFCGQFENNVPVGYAGPHTHPDGSGITNATPAELFPGYYVLGVNKLQYYNRSPGDYQAGGNCFWGWLGDYPDGDKNHTHSVYCYDRTAGDGGAMSSGWFNQVDPSNNARFNSSAYPNMNGDYVFLIKAINYQDRFNGYVSDYGSIVTGGDSKGCVNGSPGNVVRCPDTILNYAKARGLSGSLVQDGFYLRAPKDLAGGRQYLASAPSRVAFNISYGPVTGSGEPGEDHEYEEMAGQAYQGLRFQAGGAGCRNDGFSQRPGRPDYLVGFPFFGIGNADWDNSNYGYGGFEGPPPVNDHDIHASIQRLGTSDDYGTLSSNLQGPKNVLDSTISGSWQDYPGFAMSLDNPGGVGGFGGGGGVFGPYWYKNERFTGNVEISGWNDGNNIAQGGAPFTWGYWPTCLGDGTDFTVDPLSPKPIASGYKYNGHENFTQTSNNGDANLDFVFQYNLPETRGKVDYRIEINGANRGGGSVASGQGTDGFGAAATPGTHVVRVPVNVNDLQANTTYTWRACVNPGPTEKCTANTSFQVNKGPSATIVSADPNRSTNTGNVLYNCSKLAAVLSDPEGNQVRPYFAVSWTKDGQTNVVTSFNRSNPTSDTWGNWTTGANGYRASGSTFTSDDVRPVSWTVNGVSRSVPNMTLTQFLQSTNLPEGADVSWTVSGEDRYGASDVQGYPNALFTSNSTPQAVIDPLQFAMNYRRFGGPANAAYHKNSRPNLLPPGSTKKFKDLNGAEVTSVIDGQTIQVETRLVNSGETPTKSYQIDDYLGSIRDFEPIQDNAQYPITIAYNDGTERRVSPAISTVIPNHANGFLDQPENAADTNDDRQASYKLDFGANPGAVANVSITKNGKDFSSCQYGNGANAYCLTNYATYPDSVYFYCGWTGNLPGACGGTNNAPAVWSYRYNGAAAGVYDLTLNYYNRPNPGFPPPGYGSFHIKVDYPGGSKTVNLPVESDNRSGQLHTFTLRDLNVTGANPTFTVTWDNDAWENGDANFGLNWMRLATADSITNGSILRPGELAPGESVTLRYYVRANRNRTAASDSDQNSNFRRRYEVGSPNGPSNPQSDPQGGTVDIGDAHVFVPYSEDYCNAANPLLNHTCEFKPGDVVAPWLRGQRGSIASNGGVFGYDPLNGEANATFLVTSAGSLSHFSGGTDSIGAYQAAPATCAPSGQIDWRKEMYRNIQKLMEGSYNSDATTRGMLNGASVKNVKPPGLADVWVVDGDLTLDGDKTFRGVGTIVVKGDLTINGNMQYDSTNARIDSLGLIVLGNVKVKETVGNLVGTYYVSDIDRDLSGQSNGCPDVDTADGTFTTGRSNRQLNVKGALIARKFNFQRYFIDPTDSVSDPAENVYYDGRVVAATPPGFSTFRDTAAWYEIAP